jgi:hypothetical protein
LEQVKRGEKPELQPVKAQKARNGLMVHYWADFIYRSKALGLFSPMQSPDISGLNRTIKKAIDRNYKAGEK